MARQRRTVTYHPEHVHSNSDKQIRFTAFKDPEEKKRNLSVGWCTIIAFCFVVAFYFSYRGYLETRVVTPFDSNKMVAKTGLDVPNRYWGSYRPGVYFGMKSREPYSPVMGLMWYAPKRLESGAQGIRHWCEQSDNLERYGWLEHDGINFGIQEIQDGPLLFSTSFVKRAGGKNGGDWTARISITGEFREELAVLFYTAMEDKTDGWIQTHGTLGMTGHTPQLGDFTLRLLNRSDYLHESQLITVAPGLHQLRETVASSLRWSSGPNSGKRKFITLPGTQLPQTEKEPNFVISQVVVNVPFEMDIVYESGSYIERPYKLSGDHYTNKLVEYRRKFKNKFHKVFNLKEKGYSIQEIKIACASFSNLLGGVGYFYGASMVESQYTGQPTAYWKAPLYTAVPSRSFFPRGFLWDEGFHGLLVSTWDLDISLDIMAHWFDLMNIEGWIPREQILGVEARSKVPDEFVVQHNANANPPTFLLTLDFILTSRKEKMSQDNIEVVARMWPRLQAWFSWYNSSQIGDVPGSYRWRGRNSETNLELNPKTLTSGLDDYPRASHPNSEERHLDLRCWMTAASGTMARIAEAIGRPSEKYRDTYKRLSNPAILDSLHWSTEMNRYADFGLHTDAVKLKKKQRPQPNGRPPNPHDLVMLRVVMEDPDLRLVDTTFGYVSLFPLLLRVLPPDSLALGSLLSDLTRPELLWTKWGLRSLATTAPLYMKRNTEHDPPYWRGQIWVNINYLALKALNHYSAITGPYQKQARETYAALRKNVVHNVLTQFTKTGFIWEQYNDKTGQGQGSRPFNGWSSLVILIMAEIY